jgi:broad specificity phosphatase PhoE
MGIKIDKIYTSAFKRSLQTASLLREKYSSSADNDNQDKLEINLMLKLHEKGGC